MNLGALLLSLGLGGLTLLVFGDLQRWRRARALDDFYRQAVRADDAPRPTQAYRVRLAFAALGLDVRGWEQAALYAAWALAGLALGAVLQGFFGLAGFAGGAVVGAALVNGFIQGRWERVRQQMEAEIPLFLRNTAGLLQAEDNALDAMQNAIKTLDEGSWLRAWLEHWLRELQTRGGRVFGEMRAEAQQISGALTLTVFEFERLWETGGGGYARAFQTAAENLSELIAVRAQAQAKAAGALGLAKLIIVTAVFTLGYMMHSPDTRAMFLSSPMTRLEILAAAAWGVYGWRVIQELVREATE